MKIFRRLKTKYGIAHPLCVLSLLACLGLCGIIVFNSLSAYDGGSIVSQQGRATVGEVMLFGEEIFDTLIGSYSQTVAIGIEPFLAVIVHGVLGLFNAMLGMPLDIDMTVFSVPEVLVIAMIVCAIGKFLQCFECTRSFTMLTYGEFERIFGYIMMIVVSSQNITKIIYVCEKHGAMLQTLFPHGTARYVVAVFVFFLGVISSFIGILIFYITKTLVLGLQIMQLSISFFPFTSFFFEVIRSSTVIVMAMFNLLFPKIGFSFNCAAFVIGVVLLAQTSSSVEYFRVIYVESLMVPYYRFKGKINQLYKDVPSEIRKKSRNKEGIIVPAFSMERFKIGETDVANHEKWWIEITDEGMYFYRNMFLSGKVEQFFIPMEERNWFYKDNWRCLELFDLDGPKENIIRLFKKPKREISFAISREYENIFKEITEGMHATDYNALKAQLTEERRSYIEKENKAYYALTQ